MKCTMYKAMVLSLSRTPRQLRLPMHQLRLLRLGILSEGEAKLGERVACGIRLVPRVVMLLLLLALADLQQLGFLSVWSFLV